MCNLSACGSLAPYQHDLISGVSIASGRYYAEHKVHPVAIGVSQQTLDLIKSQVTQSYGCASCQGISCFYQENQEGMAHQPVKVYGLEVLICPDLGPLNYMLLFQP